MDGGGVIFSAHLIPQGQAGGHGAACVLSDSIIQYVSSLCGANGYQLWVDVFLNKSGLMDTLGRSGFGLAKSRFDDFMVSFNQAVERFTIIDIGNGKEAAKAKMKGTFCASFPHPVPMFLQISSIAGRRNPAAPD